MYLEMSRALAKTSSDQGLSDQETAKFIFRRLLTRPPTDKELSAILRYYQAQVARLENQQLQVSEITHDNEASQQRAAWTMVARSLMNLDEAITKP